MQKIILNRHCAYRLRNVLKNQILRCDISEQVDAIWLL